jgi:hypothetical protein
MTGREMDVPTLPTNRLLEEVVLKRGEEEQSGF